MSPLSGANASRTPGRHHPGHPGAIISESRAPLSRFDRAASSENVTTLWPPTLAE
jgi:hypothetical protein